MLKENQIDKPISELKERFRIRYDIGLGSITDNPDIFKQNGGIVCHKFKLCVWIWFEGYWYLTSLNSIEQFEEDIKSTYSKNQFYDYILSKIL